jgi:hypothetical protein
MTKGILECDQYPALLLGEIVWAFAKPCTSQTSPHQIGFRFWHSSISCYQHRVFIAATERDRNRRHKSR